MTEATLTADISVIKSQLETEIAKYQSEIYLRQAKIHALDVFGNSDTVQNWLQEQNPALDGATPTDLLNSAAGLERVIDLINRTRTKLERLRQRIELMKQTPIDPESEADFNKFTDIFDAQRSIDSQLFNHSMIILVDSGVLGQLCNPNSTEKTIALNQWFYTQLIRGRALFTSELCDNEVRRSLCLNIERGGKPDGLRELERLRSEGSIEFAAVNGEIVGLAATLWAKAQIEGKSTAPLHSLDIDLIICATALWLKQKYPGREVVTVTTNVKHLARFINAIEWSDI